MKYTTKEYLYFFRDYEPSIQQLNKEENDNRPPGTRRGNGNWEIFTVPTQHLWGFDSYEDAVEYALDFVKEGNWKSDECELIRFIREIEKEEI